MSRAYYSAKIGDFLLHAPAEILGHLTSASEFPVELSQRYAWEEEIRILKSALRPYSGAGKVYLEYAVPRLGKRIDAVALVRSTLFVLEFKVGERRFASHARDQVWDYALDLKNFHESSHDKSLAATSLAIEEIISDCRASHKKALCFVTGVPGAGKTPGSRRSSL